VLHSTDNGWEQITKYDSAADCFNWEETRDFMPQMGPMVGYAITAVIQPSNKAHKVKKPDANKDYQRCLGVRLHVCMYWCISLNSTIVLASSFAFTPSMWSTLLDT
jgi:hypothetical protein